jgi:hypothetical protein
MKMEKRRRVFNNLSFGVRLSAAMQEGLFLTRSHANKRGIHYMVDLYHINGLLVETWFNEVDHVTESVYAPKFSELDGHLDNIKLPIKLKFR